MRLQSALRDHTGAAAGHRVGTGRTGGGGLAETSARVVPDPGRPKARTLCLVPSAGAPLPARFAPDLAGAMTGPRGVRLVTEAAFREALGATADPESDAALAWLNAQEREAGTVLFSWPEPRPARGRAPCCARPIT